MAELKKLLTSIKKQPAVLPRGFCGIKIESANNYGPYDNQKICDPTTIKTEKIDPGYTTNGHNYMTLGGATNINNGQQIVDNQKVNMSELHEKMSTCNINQTDNSALNIKREPMSPLPNNCGQQNAHNIAANNAAPNNTNSGDQIQANLPEYMKKMVRDARSKPSSDRMILIKTVSIIG